VPVGGRTVAHYHRVTEELYFFTAGSGRMTLGDEEREVGAGDCVVIPPGQVHGLVNTGGEPLVLLCCCAPAYSHEDTVLVTDHASPG
jgi:mannose-6-phosphate isomerase-like protein (cupin superfamily)